MTQAAIDARTLPPPGHKLRRENFDEKSGARTVRPGMQLAMSVEGVHAGVVTYIGDHKEFTPSPGRILVSARNRHTVIKLRMGHQARQAVLRIKKEICDRFSSPDLAHLAAKSQRAVDRIEGSKLGAVGLATRYLGDDGAMFFFEVDPEKADLSVIGRAKDVK